MRCPRATAVRRLVEDDTNKPFGPMAVLDMRRATRCTRRAHAQQKAVLGLGEALAGTRRIKTILSLKRSETKRSEACKSSQAHKCIARIKRSEQSRKCAPPTTSGVQFCGEEVSRLDLTLRRKAAMVVLAKKAKTFEIVLTDRSKTFYSSGDKVAGRVVIEVCEVTRVSAVKVLGLGCARVQYSKGKQRCREELAYLKYEETLHLDEQPTDTDGSVTLRPGNRYEYTFGFELPQHGQLVSSYEGKFGYVRYYVKAFMERPSQPSLECRKEFEVEEPLDINTPDLLSPAGGMTEKKVTCMFIPDGQVFLNAKIDRKGFCEGEDICINAKFENSCSRIVVPKAAIIAKHIYQANGRTKVFRQKLSAVRGNHIISGMCDVWRGKSIRVPKLKPSILSCNIIRVEYALMIYVHIPGSDKLTLELPLVIGTVPYNGFGSRTNSMSSQEGSETSNSWVSLGIPSAPPSYSDIAQDCRLDSPLTPLLDDYDDSDGPIFMHTSGFQFPPPPAYSEIDPEPSGNAHILQVC